MVGFIGLIGIAAESGMVMLTFIDQSLTTLARQRKAMTEKVTLADLYEAVIQGAVYRIRPVMMTIAGSVIGLLPVMLSTGTGSEIMRRIAAPMVGGDSDADHFPGGVCGGEGDVDTAGIKWRISMKLAISRILNVNRKTFWCRFLLITKLVAQPSILAVIPIKDRIHIIIL